jgi:hypothetical protein
MTGIERRQFEMLVRVRDFGNTHASLFASSTVAQETFAAVGAAVDELTTTDGRKLAASASKRGSRTNTARRTLSDTLTHVSLLAKTLQADGRALPPFELPSSRSDVSLLSAGRQFARDVAPFDAEFSGYGLGAAQITAATAAFASAVSERGASRSEHVAARARIRDLLASATRSVRRLDLILDTALGHDNVVQAEWTRLRRIEGPRVTRGIQATEPAPSDGAAPATGSAETTTSQPA